MPKPRRASLGVSLEQSWKMTASRKTSGAAAAFLDPGIYQRLPCGCVMFAVEIDPCGPCLCIVENSAGDCGREHVVADFMPMRLSAAAALARA